MNKLSVYDASAGSGKTQALSEQYVDYLLKDNNPEAYRHILAVTFTNKATCEMKQRILDRLWHRSQEGKTSKERQDAARLLKNLVHDYTMFRVSTIDAFFQKILKSLALELGRKGAYETSLDSNGAVDSAVQKMYMKLGSDTKLWGLMKSIALSRIENGEKWNWRKDTLKICRHVVDAEYQKLRKKATKSLEEFSKDFWVRSDKLDIVFAKEVKRHLDDIVSDFDKTGLTKVIFEGQSNSHLYKILIGEPVQDDTCIDTSSSIVKIITDCPPVINEWINSVNKSEFFKKTADPSIVAIMNAHAYEIKKLFDKYYAEYRTLSLIKTHLRESLLLDHVSTALDEYLAEEQMRLLDETPSLLNDLIEGDTPFVYEKIGSVIKHYLLDEFQDTSDTEWGNFCPLLNESLSAGSDNDSLLVGDVKQSIYRWNGGDWDLFKTKVEDDFKKYFRKEYLSVNYRSLSNIVKFNNLLFSSEDRDDLSVEDKMEDEFKTDNEFQKKEKKGVGYLVKKFQDNLRTRLEDTSTIIDKAEVNRLCDAIPDIYSAWPQTVRDKFKIAKERGVVDVVCCDRENGGNLLSVNDFVLQDIVRKIKSLTEGENPKYNLGDIAVLTSSKDDAKEVAAFLVNCRISIVSGESLLLNSCHKVSLIIEALRKIQSPSSKGLEAQARILSVDLKQLDLLNNLSDGRSLLEICRKIQKDILPSMENGDALFLNAFYDKVLEFSFIYGNDISRFLQWWDENSKDFFVPEPSNAASVKIMTMHKAKGLSFKVLFIPYLRDVMIPPKGKAKWFTLDSVPLLLEYSDKNLTNTAFEKNLHDEQMQISVDNINLAYVSFTRPKERLYIYAKYTSEDRVSGALTSFCKKYSEVEDDEHFKFKVEPGQLKAEDFKAEDFKVFDGIVKLKADEGPFNYTEYIVGDPGDDAYKDSSEEKLYKEETIDATNLLSLMDNDPRETDLRYKEDVDDNMRKGVLWHQLYSFIEEVGEGQNGLEDAVRTAVDRFLNRRPVSLLGNDANKLVADVCSRINSKASYGWFDAGKRVENEASILSGSGKNMYRPDRLLLPADGSMDWAQVVDYKFGKFIEDSEENADNAGYTHSDNVKQVKNYMNLLKEMGYSDVKGWLWYVLEDKVEEVKGD